VKYLLHSCFDLDSARRKRDSPVRLLEAFMQDYEIRIFGPAKEQGRQSHTIVEVMHLNDSTALRAARMLAAGRPFELWRGIERVDFGEPAKTGKPV